jgi:hypothetical protein
MQVNAGWPGTVQTTSWALGQYAITFYDRTTYNFVFNLKWQFARTWWSGKHTLCTVYYRYVTDSVKTEAHEIHVTSAVPSAIQFTFFYSFHYHVVYPKRVRYNLSSFLSKYMFYKTNLSRLGYGLDDRRFESRQGLGIFLFTTASKPALEPAQPPIQWVPWALSLVIKRLGREADHSPPSSAEIKEWVVLYLHSSQ